MKSCKNKTKSFLINQVLFIFLLSVFPFTTSAYTTFPTPIDTLQERINIQVVLNRVMNPSPSLIVDGVIGRKSIQAIQSFQESRGLVPDGKVGPITRNALEVAQTSTTTTTTGCIPGGQYNMYTGKPCTTVTTSLPTGCTSSTKYSPVTGVYCGNTTITQPTTTNISGGSTMTNTNTNYCTGSAFRSCTISNGVGNQSRLCNNGTWSSYGNCTPSSCSSGYQVSNNTCAPVTCSGSSTQSCTISNGTGTQSRTCSNGYWSSFNSCTVSTCNSGYQQSGNSCVVIPSTTTPTWQSGLVSWWKLNGNTQDSIGTNHGTNNGATSTFSGCVSGSCYSFNGTSNYIDIGNPSSLQLTGAMTLSGWVTIDSVDNRRIISKLGGSGNRGWSLNIEGTDVFAFMLSGTGSDVIMLESNALASSYTGDLVHVVGVYDPAGSMRLYINGVLDNERTTGVPASQFNSSEEIKIGRHSVDWSNTYWDGVLDEVMVWGRALSSTEVLQVYNYFGATSSPICTPESSSTTCLNKCGTQTNNCGASVSCGTCTTPTCSGSSTQSCPISNGSGTQSRTCNSGIWSSYNTCTVSTCNSGYQISGNSCVAISTPPATSTPLLKVSSNSRYLTYQDGTPFFYLADTAWRMSSRLTREEVNTYLQKRKSQGFTVIMITVGYDIESPNAYGYYSYTNNNFNTPRVVSGINNDYWDHLDYIINKAEELGLYVSIIPVWSNKYVSSGQVDNATAKNVGKFYGERYKDKKNIIWVMGGDVKPEGKESLYRGMAEEITKAITGSTTDTNKQVLITYHAPGWYEAQGHPHTSSAYLHNEAWLDMNGIQSGHYDASEPPLLNYKYIETDYAKSPAKPTSDMESFYEGIYFKNNVSYRKGNDYDVRRNAYWSVFAGAYGYTYGNNNIWPFYTTGMGDTGYHSDTNWQTAIESTGANDMIHLKNLMMSRGDAAYLRRVPDQSLIVTSNPDSTTKMYATRDSSGTYAFVYIPTSNKSVTINTSKLSGNRINSKWFNPRDGTYTNIDEVNKPTQKTYTTPSTGPDWVLVIYNN